MLIDMLDFLYILLMILSGFALVYLLFLVRPRKRKFNTEGLLTAYAHRGLHGEDAPENSLRAFELAIENGYGIELDVQLSKDGKVVVFHDYILDRMTNIKGKICDFTALKLNNITLKNSYETIPLLSEVLDLVDGRVPLLIELKGEDLNTSLCEKVAHHLKSYSGKFCIESFNPLLIWKMKKYLPNAYYGQLYTNVCRERGPHPACLLLASMSLNFLSRPDFISYNKLDRNSLPVKVAAGLYNTPRFVWTLNGEAEKKKADSLGEYSIFEF